MGKSVKVLNTSRGSVYIHTDKRNKLLPEHKHFDRNQTTNI
jgi:hypothetical protein